MKKFRIYVFIPIWGFSNGRFDSNNFFINQALALRKAGQDPVVICLRLLSIKHLKSFQLCQLESNYKIDDMPVYIYNLYVPFPVFFNSIRDQYISFFYHYILQRHKKIDEQRLKTYSPIIHAHVSHECAYYCLNPAKKENIPLIATEHYSGLLTGAASKNDYKRAKATIEQSNKFIFVGQNFKKRICHMLDIQKEVLVIPNMINNQRFNINLANKKDRFRFLTAGTLKKNKSMDLVIRAFHNEFEKDENVELLIAGEGIDRTRLEKLVSEFNEDHRITFFGEYTKEEACQIFSEADAFALTSQFETFGIVYVEAMFCGLPCIGTKGQGADDIITDKNGFLVDYGNLQQLQTAMRHIYLNINSYDKETIRNEAIKRFSEETISEQLLEIYHQETTGGNHNV